MDSGTPRRSLRVLVCAFLSAILAPGARAQSSNPEIAFLALTGGYWQVWVMRADGSGARQVTTSTGDKIRVSWFPDARAVLVSSMPGTVRRVDVQSGAEQPVGIGQPLILDAVLAPGGTAIAYSYGVAGSRDGNDIWIADLSSGQSRPVLQMPALQHEPAWAPDGSTIVFSSGDGGQGHDLWRVRVADGATTQLTANALYNFDVTVGPRGEIAFSSNRSGDYEIWLQRDGAAAVQLTRSNGLDSRPGFSPDGQKLVFDSVRSGLQQIWVTNADGSGARQLTNLPGGARSPVWRSPRLP